MAELTGKQKRFCEEYIIDLNATQAAIRAGYSVTSAYAIGSENLCKHEVITEIDRIKKIRSERTAITAENVLRELAKLAFADLPDFVTVDKVEVSKDEKGNPIFVPRVVIKPTADISTDKLAALSEIKQTKEGISVKLHDKKGALELLGRHLALFTDKTELIGSDGGAIELKFNMKEPPEKSEQTNKP